ncbi:MAG: substrate-binding domain-containing protein [Spirochaetales bacterium]|nr:substrate-binding domain-containing protein [Spirochaetales bacterium]
MKKLAVILIVSAMILSLSFANGASETNSKINVISREEGSGTRGAFVELTGVEEKIDGVKVDQTTLDAEIASSTSVVITTVEGDKNAIGYISLGSLSDKVKAIEVDGVYPTTESVKSGEYKISRPFVVAFKTLSETAEDFLKFVMSSNGQDIVEKKGYIRVDDGNKYAYESSKKSGSVTISGSSSVYPVMEVLVEAYMALNPDVKVTLMQSDSTTGINDAISGKSDIGLSSRNLKASELEKGLEYNVMAMDGIAVIVNNGNAVKSLSSETIRDIYKGLVTTWAGL